MSWLLLSSVFVTLRSQEVSRFWASVTKCHALQPSIYLALRTFYDTWQIFPETLHATWKNISCFKGLYRNLSRRSVMRLRPNSSCFQSFITASLRESSKETEAENLVANCSIRLGTQMKLFQRLKPSTATQKNSEMRQGGEQLVPTPIFLPSPNWFSRAVKFSHR